MLRLRYPAPPNNQGCTRAGNRSGAEIFRISAHKTRFWQSVQVDVILVHNRYRTRLAHVSHTYRKCLAHALHTYRKHLAHVSHTCRKRVAHASHTHQTHVAHALQPIAHRTGLGGNSCICGRLLRQTVPMSKFIVQGMR